MYAWMSVSDIEDYEPDMERLKVSEVARGVKPSSQTDRGFLEVYKDVQDPNEMEYIMATKNQSWAERRNSFIARHLVQYEKNPTERRKLALIAWAYNPDKKYGMKYGFCNMCYGLSEVQYDKEYNGYDDDGYDSQYEDEYYSEYESEYDDSGYDSQFEY